MAPSAEAKAMSVPTVASYGSMNIGITNVILSLTVTDDGGSVVTARGTCWGFSANPTSNCSSDPGTTGTFDSVRSGLPANTLIHWVGYATNGVGTAYSEDSTFTTQDYPSVTTPTATSVTDTSATLGATLASTGSTTITARGTCWGVSATPSVNCLAEGGPVVTGAYTQARTGFSAGETYFYRGYTNYTDGAGVTGTAYSIDGAFTTPPNTPTSFVATTSADCGGEVSLSWAPSLGAYGYEFSRDGGAYYYVGNVTSWTDSGLVPVTSHTYTLQARNASGISASTPPQSAFASVACARPDIYSTNDAPSAGTTFAANAGASFWGTVTNTMSGAITEGGWAGLEIDWNSDGIGPQGSLGIPDEYYDAFGGVQMGAFTPGQTKTLRALVPNLPPGIHRYRFNVDSTNVLAESSETNNRSAWTTFYVPPPTPTNLTPTTGGTCGGQIQLTWTGVPGARDYQIARDGGAYQSVGSTTLWDDNSLTPGSVHAYTIQASNYAGYSPSSGVTSPMNASMACTLPDLIPTNFETPSAVTVGDLFWIKFNVHNQGNAPSNSLNVKLTYGPSSGGPWIPEASWFISSGIPISAYSSIVAHPFRATTVDPLFIRVCVDATDNNAEGVIGEANNCSVHTVIVNPLSPPLWCTSQTVSYCGLPTAGDSTTVPGTCLNGYGGACSYTCHNGAFDTVVTNTCAPATITTFEACDSNHTSHCVTAGGTKTVVVNTPISFYWSTANADFCQAIAGPGFTTTNSPGPTWIDVTNPATDTYTISCGNNGVASVAESISVQVVGDSPVLTASNIYVKSASTTKLNWDTRNGTDYSSCTITGPNFSVVPNDTTGDTITPAIEGGSIFTLTCGSKVDSVTVHMIPKGFES